MGLNLLDIHFNLFGIYHTITPSNANGSVAFQSFPISWNLNREYKTKVITLPRNRSTITLNEEKKMIMPTEIRNYIKTCSSRLKFLFFLQKFMFLGKKKYIFYNL